MKKPEVIFLIYAIQDGVIRFHCYGTHGNNIKITKIEDISAEYLNLTYDGYSWKLQAPWILGTVNRKLKGDELNVEYKLLGCSVLRSVKFKGKIYEF